MFKANFNPYVCDGDTITCSVDGFDVTARLVADTDSHPNDSECYSPKQIQAWRNGEWFYFGVVLAVSRNEVEITDHAASLWGIEGNFPSRRKNTNTHFREVANDLLGEALEHAKAEAAQMVAALQ